MPLQLEAEFLFGQFDSLFYERAGVHKKTVTLLRFSEVRSMLFFDMI